MDEGGTLTLWRPTAPQELASGWAAWPPRLPDQQIFYPVLNEDYAMSSNAISWSGSRWFGSSTDRQGCRRASINSKHASSPSFSAYGCRAWRPRTCRSNGLLPVVRGPVQNR